MLFNSYSFLFVFLPLMLVGWWTLPGRTLRLAFLTLMSYVFYSAFEFPTGLLLLPLLLASTSIDYVAGGWISRSDDERTRRALLVAALVVNLGLLATFKYLGFFEGSLNALMHLVTQTRPIPVHELVLPIGISFYTFNSMSYTIDLYRRRVRPARNLLEYSAFVALFPHLIAGPIVRFSDIEQQLRNLRRKLTAPAATMGIYFLVVGLFKKLVVADTLAPVVDRLYASSGDLGALAAWAAAFGYGLQLYFDFSAYSDMAVGLALLLGFRFPQNFDSPYKAANIADFWRRWHITLSRWIRDYLYVPLGGSRGGRLLTARNLLIAMFLGGLWHGAAWVFVLWGVAHGVLLAVHGTLGARRWVPRWPLVWRALTLALVMLLWVPFRAGSEADSLGTATDVLAAAFGANGLSLGQVGTAASSLIPVWFLVLVGALLVFVNLAPNTWEYDVQPRRRLGVALGAMCAAAVVLLSEPSPFLYFRF